MSDGVTARPGPASEAVRAEFAERFDLLEEAGQVTRLARLLTEYVLTQIAENLGVELTEENAAPFVTHVAIALTRLNRGDQVVAHSAVVEDEIEDRVRETELVVSLLTECEEFLGRPVPRAEAAYVTVHLCAIVDE